MKMIDEAQNMHFLGDIHELLKQWKLSLIDLNHIDNRTITRRRNKMLKPSHTIEASWWVVQADNKKKALKKTFVKQHPPLI